MVDIKLSDPDQNKSTASVRFQTVEEDFVGQRLDNYLLRVLKGVPKSRIYRLLRKGEVRVNKGRAKPDRRLEMGDQIRIPPIRVAEPEVSKTPGIQLQQRLVGSIVFEDDALLIINKPSGIAVHGGSGVSFGVIEGFRAQRPTMGYLELVHRLDRDTSGCLMMAKSRAALIQIQRAMQANAVQKTYIALVKGAWDKGKSTINAPLKKNQLSSGERVVRVDSAGKPSVSHFKVIERYQTASLLEVSLETGRTHQIRVHCQFAQQPIAGDTKYGDRSFNEQLRSMGLKRLFLHASQLEFRHPLSGDRIEVEAPLPNELSATIGALS